MASVSDASSKRDNAQVGGVDRGEVRSAVAETGVAAIVSLQQVLAKSPSEAEIVASASQTVFTVPNQQYQLQTPFTDGGTTYKYKVGPCCGDTMEAAQAGRDSLEEIADSGYLGQLVVRQILHDEAKKGLLFLAESGKELKNLQGSTGSWFFDRKAVGNIVAGRVSNGVAIRVATGDPTEILRNCAHECAHHVAYSISEDNLKDPSYHHRLKRSESDRNPNLKELMRPFANKPFNSEIFAHAVHVEVQFPGSLKSYAPETAVSVFEVFKKLESKLNLQSSKKLGKDLLMTAEELAARFADFKVAQFLASTSIGIKKILESKMEGSRLADVICVYNPNQENAVQKAIEEGTAIFTMGTIQTTSPGAGLRAMGMSNNQPSCLIIGISVAGEVKVAGQSKDPAQGAPLTASSNAGRPLKWVSPGFVWRKYHEAGEQRLGDFMIKHRDLFYHENSAALLLKGLERDDLAVKIPAAVDFRGESPSELPARRPDLNYAESSRSIPLAETPPAATFLNREALDSAMPQVTAHAFLEITREQKANPKDFRDKAGDFLDKTQGKPKPILSPDAARDPLISLPFENYQKADKAYYATFVGKERQKAFDERYAAAKQLIDRGLKAEDLQSGDPNFAADVVRHYGLCAGSYGCVDAFNDISFCLSLGSPRLGGIVDTNMIGSAEIIIASTMPGSESYHFARNIIALGLFIDFKESVEAVNNPALSHEQRQSAFLNLFSEAKKIESEGFTKDELGIDPSFIQDFLKHYEWCEGSRVCSEASNELHRIFKAYCQETEDSETKEKKTIVHLDRMNAVDRTKMQEAGETIAKAAKTGGPLQQFGRHIVGKSLHLQFAEASACIYILEYSSDDKQKAFDQLYEISKKLIEGKYSADELESDPAIAMRFIHHYSWCEGSLSCSIAAGEIESILQGCTVKNGDKAVLQLHRITSEDRVKMRMAAETILSKAKADGLKYQFAQAALRSNYQILADSYGKYGSLLVSNMIAEYSQQGSDRVKIAGQVVATGNIFFPNFGQNLLVLPLAFAQKNSEAALHNLGTGLVDALNILTTPWNHKADFLDRLWRATTGFLPHLLDEEKYRTVLQYTQTASSAVSKLQSFRNGTLAIGLATTTPFSLYEFLTSEPNLPESRHKWSWLDELTHYAHSNLSPYVPDSLKPGNLPENLPYYAVKHSVENTGIALSSVMATNSVRGKDVDGRDAKAAALFVLGLTAFQAWMGKFENELCIAMQKNAQYNMQKQQYAEAIPSVRNLLERVKAHSEQTDLKWIKWKIFAQEAYFACVYNRAFQLIQQGKQPEAEPLLDELKRAAAGDYTLFVTDLNTLSLQKEYQPLHQKTKQVRDNVTVLEKQTIVLLHHIALTA